MRIVIALGGNALAPKGGRGDYAELKANIQHICRSLVFLAKKHNLVITHGSGPQIGNLILQNELTRNKVSPMPMDVLDAELEGELGYMIQQSLLNELHKHNLNTPIVTILTQVLVDKRDPLFKKPTKPVGPFYTKERADVLKREGFSMIEDAGRGYRKVVPSPEPKGIVESRTIQALVKRGNIVIAAGGGGIPVYKERNMLKGIAAVIDKDLASSCLARSINADLLLILTGVDYAYLNYAKPGQTAIRKMSVKQAKKYLLENHFAEGSMKPKIEAAISFLEHNGKEAIITSPENVRGALQGKCGTHMTK